MCMNFCKNRVEVLVTYADIDDHIVGESKSSLKTGSLSSLGPILLCV